MFINMDYAEKLKQFNGTLKYNLEHKFLCSLIGNGKLKILDYGCGLGASVLKINAYTNHAAHGFDVEDYNPEFSYLKPYEFDTYDVIYFMHSIAHIQYLDVTLKKIKVFLKPGGRIIVVTPNRDWVEENKNDSYKPDPTVIKHFNQSELIDLFESCGFTIEQSGQFGQVSGIVNERIYLVAKWAQ